MIKRIIDSRQPIIVYNPPKVFDLNYFAAVNTSGALPVIDTEFMDEKEIFSCLDQLIKKEILFGIRIKISEKTIIDHINKSRITNLDAVVLAYDSIDDLRENIITNYDYKVLLEVLDININDRIQAVEPDAVILKGNEAPGRVSKYTSFILMQWYLEKASFPVFIHGGVGMYTVGGMFSAGVMGVVLDDQLYLTDEAPLSPNFKKIIEGVEESDSVLVGMSLNVQYRFFAKLGTKIVKAIKEEESLLKEKSDADSLLYDKIKSNFSSLDNPNSDAMQSLFYLGQDGIFAKKFIRSSKKLKDVIYAFISSAGESLNAIDDFDPLVEGSKLADYNGTKYPIIQGPMANISDNADFAKKIYEAGAVPVFAMGNLPAENAEKMLSSGKEKSPVFAAGLIGLVAMKSTFQKHVELLQKYKPKFAIIAAGNASQAIEIENLGIETYLHAPAMGILDNAITGGCKRFIFEGNEAGGHIGSLTSFVLWENAMHRFMSQSEVITSKQTAVFAGGIGTRSGSYFISGLTSVLAKRGAAVGIQVGTPYMFTEEIVKTGALTDLYQKLLIKENDSTVIGSTMGLSTRTIITPFSKRMLEKEYNLIKEKVPLEERKKFFELQNIGSLLVAAKAFSPDFEKLRNENKLVFINYNEEDHLDKGNFHSGESLAFYQFQITIKDIHDMFFTQKKSLIENLNNLEIFSSEKHQINDEIAVIGMGGMFPDAPNMNELWKNIISKKYSIRKVSKERMNSELHFSADRKEDDKTYSQIGGEIDYFKFNAAKYGFDEKQEKHMSRSQKLLIEAAFQALEDSGYTKENFPKKKTSVVIGTCLGNELSNDMQFKYAYPEIRFHLDQIDEFKSLDEKIKLEFLDEFKKNTSFGLTPKHPDGAALNIEASRITKLLGLEGINYTVDAACATSFAALDNAMKELLSGESDIVITGGVNSNLSPEPFVGFSKMGALSNDGSYPFDERANGFVLGEGAGVFIIKRLKDAVRDKDKIHVIIKGIGSSSDGKGKAIAAPSSTGQSYSLRRCFENIKTEVSIDDIDYIEAHGTSTVMGDAAEMETLKSVYAGKTPKGVSSIKSQVGHLLGGAGAAGFIKAVLAIKNKTLPPNGQFSELAKKHKLDGSSFYVIKDPVKWEKEDDSPRMAAVSSYGFGGINYHLIIQEYLNSYKPVSRNIFSNPDYDFNDDRIVAAGLGVVLPGADNIEELWKVLEQGKNVITEIPDDRFHNDYYAKETDPGYNLPKIKAGVIHDFKFNTSKYKIPPTALRAIDRSQLLALDAASQAIEHSGLSPKLINGNRVGVVLGTTAGEKNLENIIRTRIPFILQQIKSSKKLDSSLADAISNKLEERLKIRYFKNMEDSIPGLLSNIVTGRIANFFNCNGPNFIVDAECASSAVALYLAIKELQSKDSDFIISGGVDTNLSAQILMAFHMIKVISPTVNKFFDKNSSGLVMGEGAALMVLTTYKKARENNMRIIGEISGFSFKSFTEEGLIAPVENGFVQVMENVYSSAQPNAKQVSYIDVFAGSHVLVDKREYSAITRNFKHDLYFGNSKPELSYFRSANPAVVITKLLLMSLYKKILPNYSYDAETSIVETGSSLLPNNKIIDMDYKDSVYLAANFSGLGGIHGHVVVRTLPSKFTGVKLAAISEETKAVFSRVQEEKPSVTQSIAGEKNVAVLLSGQGSQSCGMMKELYKSDEAIRSVMIAGEKIFMDMRGYSLLGLMFGTSADIHSTQNSQPAVFLSCAAIYTVLKNRGFNPQYFIGHSIGEYTALYCAGILGFEEAMKLVCKRGEIMKKATLDIPGSIMVVFKGSDEVKSLIEKSGLNNVFIANKNSMKQTVVSGGVQEIKKLCSFLNLEKVIFSMLNLSGAFHTPFFERASEEMRDYLKNIKFINTDFTRVISNVTGKNYPDDELKIKDLLVKQIKSPVEFIKSVEHVYSQGVRTFIEIGPNRILTNLLNDIRIRNFTAVPSIEPKVGEIISFKRLNDFLNNNLLITQAETSAAPVVQVEKELRVPDMKISAPSESNDEFNEFLKNNQESLNKMMYEKFLSQKREREIGKYEKFGFYTGRIVISGVSAGLPGTMNKVFDENNFDKILKGVNFIESITEKDKNQIADKNIIRISKDPSGNAKFVEIKSAEDVIQLAGRLGYFNLKDYGIEYNYDQTYGLAIASGIEALKDANIPLVTQFEKLSTGKTIAKGMALPEEMQARTGVIFSSIISGLDTILKEAERFSDHKLHTSVFLELEKIYYYMLENVSDQSAKSKITEWFFNIKNSFKDDGEYKFERNFLFNIFSLASGYFAEIIKAKGPNTQSNAVCASITQAVGIAEDWIRTDRCDRVIIISGESATSEATMPWIGSGFLALGAATVKKIVSEAAKPFDRTRNGMILGSGAASLIIEREDKVKERGLNGQAEVLGTYFGNSAFHPSRIDVNYVAGEMKTFIEKVEKTHHLDKKEYVDSLIFMSHETYTPARGGSADAEISALKNTFPDDFKKITISNTKGFTGHTLSAGIEDSVLVKALQTGIAPPIANLKDIPEHFSTLKFSKGESGRYEYGLHIAVGFSSHFAMLFIKRITEAKIENNALYRQWLTRISNNPASELQIINNTLCIKALEPSSVRQESLDQPKVSAVSEKKTAPKAVLASIPAPVQSGKNVSSDIKKIIADQTGYTLDMLEDTLDLEADLGIDTVKQVEIFNKICQSFGFDAPDDVKLTELNTISKISEFISAKTGTGVRSTVDVKIPAADGNVSAEIKKIIAEQTGYTLDMLDDTLDLEADLGIDTVKQVEIFNKICQSFGFDAPDDVKLTELNTISKISEFISEKTGTGVRISGSVQSPAADGNVSAEIKKIIAEQTGYTLDMLEDTLDLESDLGIDTVKQVEIFNKICQSFGFDAPDDVKLTELNTISKISEFISEKTGTGVRNTGSVQSHAADGNVSAEIKKIIAEQTGYTLDMLDDNLDLEADLGIDTVKQVEIFNKICSHFGIEVPEDIRLGEMNSIAKMADFITGFNVSSSPNNQGSPDQTSIANRKSGENFTNQIKAIISEQTGYTEDMLDDNLDLEADLGIDTVKQVEIFSKVCSHFGFDAPDDVKLGELNSIHKISEYISGFMSGKDVKHEKVNDTPQIESDSQTASDSIKRLVLKIIKAPLSEGKLNIFKDKTILITPDMFGFAETLSEKIKSAGGKTVLIGGGKSDYNIDLAELRLLENKIKIIAEERNDISGFIHLYPLNGYFDSKKIDKEIMDSYIKSFFVIVKGLYKNLNTKDSLVSAISFNSVIFPYGENKSPVYPPFAALAGMMKTVNKELKDALVKIVDFSEVKPRNNKDDIINRYMVELGSGDRRVETGYDGLEKFVITLAEEKPRTDESFINNGDTVIITGGARGITFEILKGIVQKYKIKPVLLGRSEIDGLDAAYLKPGIDEKTIFESLKSKMAGAKPVEIKKAALKILNQIESLNNIDYLKSLGVEPEYHAVDVCDFKALSSVMSKYQTINGVIHAAGIEESQIIEKKELNSFNRVFDTKITGMINLLSALGKMDYRFLITFSSVTAKFGNEGQIDYTGANNMLTAFLQREKAKNPGRVYKAYDWTAWDETGMAMNESAKKILVSGGIELLPVKKGVDFFVNDLTDSVTGEIVVTNIIPAFDPDGIFPNESGISMSLPFLGTETEKTESSVKFARVLDLKTDIYLKDHTRDNVPIFLGATGIETMAEAAICLADTGKELISIKDFSIPYGVKLLKGRPKEIIISANVNNSQKDSFDCSIISQFMRDGKKMGDPTLHYKGVYSFGKFPKKVKAVLPEFRKVKLKKNLNELIYHPKRLFMEGLFQSITEILSFENDTLVTKITNKTNGKFFNLPGVPEFILDPVIVDGMFQTGGLVDFMKESDIILPYKISELIIFDKIKSNSDYICVTRKSSENKETKIFQLELSDVNGNLILQIKDFEMVFIEKLEEEFRVSDLIE